MTLRSRVFRYVAAATIGVCVLTVLIGAVLVRHRLAAAQLTTLTHQADVVAAVGGAPGARQAGTHIYRIGSGHPRRAARPLAREVLAAIAASGRRQGRIEAGGEPYLFAARATALGEVILIRRSALLFGQWRPFLLSLLFAGLGGALVAGAVSWLLARRLTRPIAALAAATTRVGAGESGIEVGVEGEDELAGLARSFNAMASGLAATRAEQRRFLESVSHELRTPLSSIVGYAEALADGAVEPALASRVIGAEAGRLRRLVADLLDLARFQRAGFSVRRETIDLADLARRAVERHEPSARELGVRLLEDRDGPAPARGDPDRILQATSNLIENALRLTPAGGSVTVRARSSAIEIADTGPGLAGEDLPRAFERFYLYDRYRSEREVGTGLGLAIVHELAALMGGEITVDSPPGRGARFTLRLPPAGPPVDA